MQQTIHFDPQHDPVSTVLLQVARAYGFAGITEAMASDGKPQGIYPKPPRKPQIAWQPLQEIAWEEFGGSGDDLGDSARQASEPFSLTLNGSPWNMKTATGFLHHLTIPAQRGIALMVVKGTVPIDEMAAYLGVESMQGVFSTIGSAVKNTDGLPNEARPYWRHRSPKKVYRMDPPMQQLFRDVYLNSRRVKVYLEQAEQYVSLTEGSRR